MVWIQGLRSTTPGSNELQPCKLVSSNNGEVEDVVAEAVGLKEVPVENTNCSQGWPDTFCLEGGQFVRRDHVARSRVIACKRQQVVESLPDALPIKA